MTEALQTSLLDGYLQSLIILNFNHEIHSNTFSFSLLFTLFSCQKVINVNLNDAKPQYVIEASMYEGTHDFKVKITQTTSYFEPQSVPLVNDAVVTLYDNNLNALPLTATGNGWYECQTLQRSILIRINYK